MSSTEIESQKEHLDKRKASSTGETCREAQGQSIEQQIIPKGVDEMTTNEIDIENHLLPETDLEESQHRQREIEMTRAGVAYLSDASTLEAIGEVEKKRDTTDDVIARLMAGEKISNDDLLATRAYKHNIDRNSDHARGRYNDFLDGIQVDVDLAEVIRKAILESYEAQPSETPLDPSSNTQNANFRQLFEYDLVWSCDSQDGGEICGKHITLHHNMLSGSDPIHVKCPKCEQETTDLRYAVGGRQTIPFKATARATLDCILRACIGNEFPDSKDNKAS